MRGVLPDLAGRLLRARLPAGRGDSYAEGAVESDQPLAGDLSGQINVRHRSGPRIIF